MLNVAIIGAGISGVTTAYYLSKHNFNISLIESRRYPGMATSYANGGQLSASNSEAWNSWANVLEGAKGLFKNNSPISINPVPSLEKIIWLLSFIKNIKNRNNITFKICSMACESVKLYKEIEKDEKIKFDLLDKGIVHFYNNKDQTNKALSINKIYRKAGLIRNRISHQELYNIEPSLKNKTFDSIFFTSSDKTGDIHKFCNNLTKKLLSKKNIKFVNYEVVDLSKELEKYDKIIVCAGVNSRKLALSVGDKLPIYPVKGYSITINKPGLGTKAPWVSLLDDANKIVTSRLGKDRLRIAGTAEFNGYNLDIIQNRIRPLISWCTNMFPNINSNDIKAWAGLRPMTPNMLPIVCNGMNNKIWYNTGHGHLGWTLSAVTAKNLVNKLMLSI